MKPTFRTRVKKIFDDVIYRYPLANKIARSINKGLSNVTPFRVRPFGVFTVRLKSGITFRMSTNETSTVTKRIFWEGADAYEYTPIFEKLAKKCSSFTDVGANLGYYSLLALRSNPSIIVYAFEPAAALFRYLNTNVRLNNAQERIKCYELALSNKTGSIPFQELRTVGKVNLGGTGKLAENGDVNAETVIVPSDTMDNFFSGKQPLPDLIKIDTEGTENLILSGATNILSTHRPIIICETLFNVIEKELEEIMLRHEYQFFNLVNGHLQEVDQLTRKTDNGVRDCFFVHPDKKKWIEEFLKKN